jgi:hypothetical protein
LKKEIKHTFAKFSAILIVAGMAAFLIHPLVHAVADASGHYDLPVSPDQHSSSQHEDCLICVLAYSLSSEFSESGNSVKFDTYSNFYIWIPKLKLKSTEFDFSLRAPPSVLYV